MPDQDSPTKPETVFARAQQQQRASEQAPSRRAGDVIPTKTHEEWAAIKGMLPAEKGKAFNVDAVSHAAAKGLRGWTVGAEMTEAEFDAAVDEAMNFRIA